MKTMAAIIRKIQYFFAWVLALLPRSVRYLLRKIISEINYIINLSIHIRDETSHITIGDTNFSLRLAGGLTDLAHGVRHSYVQATGGIYEEIIVGSLSRILDLDKRATFVDIGSYAGYFACFVSAYIDDQNKVYAIESNEGYCKYIKESIRENKFNNMTVFNEALSDDTVTAYIRDKSVIYQYSGKYSGHGPNYIDPYKVTTIAFDDLCERERITPRILKVDANGAEGKIFGGSNRCLQDSILWIVLELHQNTHLTLTSPGYQRPDILSLLKGYDFDLFNIGGVRPGGNSSPERKHFLQNQKPLCIPLPENNLGASGFERIQCKQGYWCEKEDLFILAVSTKVPQSERDQVFDVLGLP